EYRWSAALVFALDGHLRHLGAIFEYTENSDCIFRLQVRRLEAPVRLSDGTCHPAGGRILDLHLWNEHIPRLHRTSLAWGRRMVFCTESSLRELAQWLAQRPDLKDVNLIRAYTGMGSKQKGLQLERIADRFGFEAVPEHGTATVGQRFHRLGENVLKSLLVLACNAEAFRPDNLWRGRTQFFLSRRALERGYGDRSIVS